MPVEDLDLARLAERFRRLGAADRRAVLKELDEEDQVRVLAAIEAEEQDRKTELERQKRLGRQFEGYSTWLARVVEAALTRDPALDGTMTELTRERVAQIHKALRDQDSASVAPGWRGILRGMLMLDPANPGAKS